MIEWILIIVFTNYSPSHSTISITSQMYSFPTEKACIESGTKSLTLANDVKFVCVKSKN